MKKILIISNKPIIPSLDGGALAIKKLAAMLLKMKHSVDLIAISKKNNTSKSLFVKKTNPLKNLNYILFQLNMSFNIKVFLRSIMNHQSYQANRFYNKKIKNFIQKKINENNYDFIVFESIFSVVYLNHLILNKNIKTILRTHNIEHKIWLDLSSNTTNVIKKILYYFLSFQIEIIEKNITKKIDNIITISETDSEYFKTKYPLKTKYIPVTFDIEQNHTKKIARSIVHLGSMDWKPNIEGINWFINYVYPLIKNDNIKIFVAGKKMPNKLLETKYKNLFIEGKVENAKKYISNKQILFVPLFSGSGIRIKILESMALGIPVVSTSIGAEGIPYTNKLDILIANTPKEFKESIKILINDSNFASNIGNNGRKLIQDNFSTHYAIKRMKDIIK